ncbi:hypothetical protein EMGBS8_05790 [Verrucomicrobiota bacterium]|nr:hypothetical protein EMGBS8_05790 [Verrucomicrobiota bacterium]
MKAFPFLTNYVNQTFENEKGRLDYIFLRPILQVSYFFLKAILFPLKFLFHRRAYGFEAPASTAYWPRDEVLRHR